jgi:hypothetical protein
LRGHALDLRERVAGRLRRAIPVGPWPNCSKSALRWTLGRPKIAPATEKAIRAALAKGGTGMHKIAGHFGVGTGTVQRIKPEMAA